MTRKESDLQSVGWELPLIVLQSFISLMKILLIQGLQVFSSGWQSYSFEDSNYRNIRTGTVAECLAEVSQGHCVAESMSSLIFKTEQRQAA